MEDILEMTVWDSEPVTNDKYYEETITEIPDKEDLWVDGYENESSILDYVDGLDDSEDKNDAYDRLLNDGNYFMKRELEILDKNSKAELEKFRKIEYKKLTDEDKKRIAIIEKGSLKTVEIPTFEQLTDKQKNAIFLSPDYFLTQELTDMSVYISSYLNYTPIAYAIYKYSNFSSSYHWDKRDFFLIASSVIIEVLKTWDKNNSGKQDRYFFINLLIRKIKAAFRDEIKIAVPSFEENWRRNKIKETIKIIELKRNCHYSYNSNIDVLIGLTDQVNSELNHKNKYSVRSVISVLKRREWEEKALDTYQNEEEGRYIPGLNCSSAEAVFFENVNKEDRQRIHEELNKKIEELREEDRKLISYIIQGLTHNEIGKHMGLPRATVSKRWERIKKGLQSEMAHLKSLVSEVYKDYEK